MQVCDIKETDNNHSRSQSLQFRFNISAEIVCNQLNFNRKFFCIQPNFLIYAIIRLIQISATFFPSHLYFFRLQIEALEIAMQNKADRHGQDRRLKVLIAPLKVKRSNDINDIWAQKCWDIRLHSSERSETKQWVKKPLGSMTPATTQSAAVLEEINRETGLRQLKQT